LWKRNHRKKGTGLLTKIVGKKETQRGESFQPKRLSPRINGKGKCGPTTEKRKGFWGGGQLSKVGRHEQTATGKGKRAFHVWTAFPKKKNLAGKFLPRKGKGRSSENKGSSDRKKFRLLLSRGVKRKKKGKHPQRKRGREEKEKKRCPQTRKTDNVGGTCP